MGVDELVVRRLERRVAATERELAATERELAAARQALERLTDAFEMLVARHGCHDLMQPLDVVRAVARADEAKPHVLTLTESRGGGDGVSELFGAPLCGR